MFPSWCYSNCQEYYFEILICKYICIHTHTYIYTHTYIHTHIYKYIYIYSDGAGESHSQNFLGQGDHRAMYSLTSQWVSWTLKGVHEDSSWKYFGHLAVVVANLPGSSEACG